MMKSQAKTQKVFIQILLFSILWLIAPPAMEAQSPTYDPGQSYWGRNQYIEYIAGDLPIILAAPHGGYLKPSEISDRTSGSTGNDYKSQEYTREVAQYITEMTCGTPHVIINQLARVKLDANRDKGEAAQGDQWAEQAWEEFHAFIEAAKATSVANSGQGHFFDLHTNDHSDAWVEVGITLSSSQLKESDETLDSAKYKDKATIRNLANTSGSYFPELVRGETSLGGFLQAQGYKSVPSPAHPDPAGGGYFNGGYNTIQHGSRYGGTVDGTQVETYYKFVKDGARDAYSQALAKSIVDFYETHYGVTLRKASCDTSPNPDDGNLPGDQPGDSGTNSDATQLNIEPVQTVVYPGSSVEVNVTVNNAVDLYGLQVTCFADPAVLAWQSTQFGDFFTAPLIGANDMDTTAGTWVGAVSQKNPAPSLSGSGVFATLTFKAIMAGTTTVTCEPLAADRDGGELPMSVSSEPITVMDTSGFSGGIMGNITYQGRTDHTGIEVKATGALTTSVQTDSAGQFVINELSGGDYTVEADAASYLPSCAAFTLNDGKTVTLKSVALAGGDTDDNDAIKINDATLVGSNFGLSATSSPAMSPKADINADGQVNVQDLSILGGNFGKEGCQEWLPVLPIS